MQIIGFIFDMVEGVLWLCGAFALFISIIYMLYNVLLKQVLLNKEIPLKTKIIETIVVILSILGGCAYLNSMWN